MSQGENQARPLARQDVLSDQVVAPELPYGSDLMASLAALMVLWDSPSFQRRVLQAGHEGLDRVSHQVVRHLGFRGPTRPSELAEEIGTGRSNMSKILGRLRDRDLIADFDDPHDGRASRVRLTGAGQDVARYVYDLGDQLLREVVESWDPADVEALAMQTRRFVSDALRAAERQRRQGLQSSDGSGPADLGRG